MKVLRKLLIASLSVAFIAAGGLRAAAPTNFSDQWWVADESGWGASIHQQSSTLVVDVLIYAIDGRATWFVAAAALQAGHPSGHTVFAGDLYATTGPYYGAGLFDSASVNVRKVGTLTFDASSANNATISYSVDGTPVVKNVTRHTWDYEDLSGTYYGGWQGDRSNCAQAPIGFSAHFEDPLAISVVQNADNTVNVTLRYQDGGSESFSGIYTQSGHLGRIEGTFHPEGAGSLTVSEIEITSSGFSGRFEGDLITSHWRDWCDMKNGQIVGMRR